MHGNTQPTTDRGQAYTLEGFIGALVVLMAILFALQSVVIMPTTGGSVDRTVQAQLQQEAQDALNVAATDDEAGLSYMVRYWDGEEGFDGTNQSGPDGSPEVYSASEFTQFTLGEILHDRFVTTGQSYNVELHTEIDDTRYLVYQGSPSSNAVTASYTVALYDEQEVTSESDPDSLADAANSSYDETISQLDDDRALYNVVEVRVIVW